MKRVVIISYFYTPANFVGSDRVSFWAEKLSSYGVYPIVVTRQWNEGQKDLVDKVIKNELEIERKDNCEVHRLPFKHSLRDKLAHKKGFRFLQKMLTFSELLFSRFSVDLLPYGNFYHYTKDFLSKNPDVNCVLISARPFNSFLIGHMLKRKFKHIDWIADYRDDWTTGMTYKPEGLLQTFLHTLDKKSERKWLSNSKYIISSSGSMSKVISNFVNRPSYTILNGFNEIIESNSNTSINQTNRLRILYSGTLYSNQKIEILIDAIASIKEDIELVFIGSDVLPNEWLRLKSLQKTYPFIEILPRVPKDLLIKEMNNADVFFTTAYEGMGGFVPVKCYDYLSWDKPVILCPSDQDEIQNFLISTNAGMAVSTVQECKAVLLNWQEIKERGEKLVLKRNQEVLNQYSRLYQTEKLAKILLEN